MKSAYEKRGAIALITLDSPPVNALGHALRDALFHQVGVALADPQIEGIVLVGATPRAFSAGADIGEFGTPASMAFPSLNDLIERIEQAAKPCVAAVAGFALGGGMELALGCHARIASERATFGLPEIRLGLMPGAGGTQRLPRLIGRAAAREFIVSGRSISAAQALENGIVDAVIDGDLADGAVKWLTDRLAAGAAPARTSERPLPEESDAPASRDASPIKGYALPVETIDSCIALAGTVPFEAGVAQEQKLFDMLVARPESAALRYAFFAEREAASLADPAARGAVLRKPMQIAVVGAGTMGGGIAMCFANAGLPVKLYDAQPASLERGLQSIRTNYAQQADKGRLTSAEAERRSALIVPVGELADLADSDLVTQESQR